MLISKVFRFFCFFGAGSIVIFYSRFNIEPWQVQLLFALLVMGILLDTVLSFNPFDHLKIKEDFIADIKSHTNQELEDIINLIRLELSRREGL